MSQKLASWYASVKKYYHEHKTWIDRFWHTFAAGVVTIDVLDQIKFIVASPSASAIGGLVAAILGVTLKAVFLTEASIPTYYDPKVDAPPSEVYPPEETTLQ